MKSHRSISNNIGTYHITEVSIGSKANQVHLPPRLPSALVILPHESLPILGHDVEKKHVVLPICSVKVVESVGTQLKPYLLVRKHHLEEMY